MADMVEEQNVEEANASEFLHCAASGENRIRAACEKAKNAANEKSAKAAAEQSGQVEKGQTAIIMPFPVPSEQMTVGVKNFKKKPVYDFFKRLADIVICSIALIALSWLFLLIAIIVKCSSHGPIIYKQERLGFNGKIITVPKFRSMGVDAEKDGARWSEGDDDPRIYSFGRFLRKSRLDELPQLWCCVIGTMSLVGPRPERECFAAEFEKYIHGFSERLRVKPGLTGWAQVNGGYDLPPEKKIVYDVEYIEKRSLWLDFKIMLRTIGVIFKRDGAK